MANKKVQAQMQINVSFLSDTTKLVKQLESATKNLNLDSSFGKQFSATLNKSFKDVYSNIDRMTEGLSKKGLSSKQYTAFFNSMNARLKDSIQFTQSLKKNLSEMFNSAENKQALKDLQAYKKQLEEINKLATAQKGAATRKNTAITKMKDETGIDYNLSKRMINSISARRANNQPLTKNQQDWASANNLDEGKLKRLLELYRQITTQIRKIDELNRSAKSSTGQSGVSGSQEYLEKQISKLEESVISPAANKTNMAVATQIEQLSKNLDMVVDEQIPQFEQGLSDSEEEAERLAQASNTIREIFAQFGIVFSAATIVRAFQDLAKSAFNFYRSLDSALNEIYVVSNLTSEAVNGLKSNFINMAKETGMAIDDVTKSAVLFYQQGLNTDEVLTMTEVTSQFAKVAGIDATDAADKLTAAVNGYCLAAEDASLVADKFNKVAAASAADINELSTAFSKAAAQANQAGVSMDNYLAYIATMEEATREAPENIGTSLKTIFSRMQQVKEGGTTEDGETDVNKVETALKSVGIQLRDTEGELRDLEDVFDELGPKWNTLDRNTQAYLGTIIAGTRQQSRFITLMQNWDRVLDLSEQSANSAGMQALMHAKAMDSIESKMQQFQVTWQEFVSNIASSDLFKGLISSLTKLLNVFSSGNKPIMLLATGIGLLSSKLKNLQAPLVNKLKDFANTFKAIAKTGTGQYFTDQTQKDAALAENKKKQIDVQSQINAKTQQLDVLTTQMQAEQTEEKQKAIAKEREQIEGEIVRLKKEQTDLGKQEKEISEQQIMTKREAIGKTAVAAGTLLNMAGMAVGQKDDNLAGVMGSLGTTATAIGQFATGNWIGGIASTATAAYQIFETVDKWDENIKARVDEAVNSVNNALTDTTNFSTGIKSTETLLKNYDSLSKKLYKTEAEQQELNDTIQQLGDTYGIDVLTDAYGNLSINIAEVNKALDEQKAKKEEALKELNKTETESLSKGISGTGNDTTISEYMSKLFSTTRSQYKNLLNGVEDGLTDEFRGVSRNVAEAFSSNLKTSIVDYVEENADEYIVEGLGNGITNLEKGIEETLNKSANHKAWTDLYGKIDFLEKNINDMTYEQSQQYLDEYFVEWKDKIGLTQQQWDILKDSINNTVFKNDSLTSFFEDVGKLQAKGTTDYWTNSDKSGKLDRLEKELKQAYNDYNKSVGGLNKTGTGTGRVGDETFEGYLESVKSGDNYDYDNWFDNATRFKEGDEAATKLDGVAKAYKEAREEQEKFYQKYAEQNNLDNRFEAEKYINALSDIKTALEGTNNATLTYLGTIENLYDTEGMSGTSAEQYAESIKQITAGLDLMTNSTDADKYNYLARYYEANKSQMTEDVKKQWEDILDEAFEDLAVSTPKKLKAIGTELQDISKDLVKMNDIIQDFADNGGLALDTFLELADIIDGINLDELGKLDPSAVDAYIKAIDNLNLAYDANTGYITMNAQSVATLQDIQELQTKSKIAGMINDLKASKATTETQIAYIDAQIAATDAAIQVAQMDSTNTVTSDQIKTAANSAFTNDFNNAMESITGSYENDAVNQGQWSTTILSNLGTVADAWSKYFTGIANGSTESLDQIKGKAKDILKGVDMKWEGAGNYSGIDWSKYDTINKGSEQQKQLLSDLQNYKSKLENTKKSYQATLSITEKEISLLENMYNSDLSNMKGSSGSGGSKNKIETYIGQLKEIYNILNRIQVLEHRLSTLDTYADISKGEKYGSLLQERLGYNEQLLSQYDFLVSEQKQFTNGYKDFIGSVSGLEGVFDFDKYGQIIINWEKYVNLQDQAANGEVTLKQKADDVYETYTSMFKELQDDFDNYIKYLKAVIDLQQEMIDSYVSMEDKAADAVKEIYQKILDTKLDAIDKEKEAIEDLRRAREEARQDQENAKAVSGLQTNIQRAMMDTSGASDSALIKAQQDLDGKLEEMAEDKYSKMLDDIIDQLEEEQNALQDEFDQLWEDMDWLFDWLDSEIMRDEDRLTELLQQTEEWHTSSSLQREQLMQDWNTEFETYIQGLKNGKTILDVWDSMNANRERIGQLDTSLVNEMSKDSKEIVQTIKSWQTDVNSTIKSAVSKATSYYSGGGRGGGGGTSTRIPKPGDPDFIGPLPQTLSGATDNNNNYKYGIGTKVKIHTNGILPGKSPNYYDSKGVKKGESTFEKKGAIVERINIPGMGNLYRMEGLQYFYKESDLFKYKRGGMVNFTGPAWLDGTSSQPEAVLNALQTEHFIKFTNALDNMFGSNGCVNTNTGTVNIDNIQFHVDSMSSPEDGEKAFNVFVSKFKEIGNQTGIKIDTFKNTL